MTLSNCVLVDVNKSKSGKLCVIVKQGKEAKVNSDEFTASLNLNLQESDLKIIFLKEPESVINVDNIVCLNLANSCLSNLPDSLGSLKLVSLNISHNTFKEIPNCIYMGLKLLEELNLSFNELKSFSDVPACYKRLRVLDLNYNNFPNLPLWIQQVKCFNLEELYYSFNEIVGFRRSKFHKVSSYCLKRLEMRNCMLRSQDLKYLKLISNLQHLDISNEHESSFNGFASTSEFSKMFIEPRWDDSLRILNMSNVMIDYLPEEIRCLVNLEELYLSRNSIIHFPVCLSYLEKLKILDISHNEIYSLQVDGTKWQSLVCLRASNNYISGVGDIFSLHLQTLDLYENYIDCNINLKSSIKQVDLERNSINVEEFEIPNYESMKTSLRIAYKCQSRLNGPKENEDNDWPNSECGSSSLESYTSDVVENKFINQEEECWDTVIDCEVTDNGCTLSDNEWVGYEEINRNPIPIRKNNKDTLASNSSWIFEDANDF